MGASKAKKSHNDRTAAAKFVQIPIPIVAEEGAKGSGGSGWEGGKRGDGGGRAGGNACAWR